MAISEARGAALAAPHRRRMVSVTRGNYVLKSVPGGAPVPVLALALRLVLSMESVQCRADEVTRGVVACARQSR
jgi:hypothetical protein